MITFKKVAITFLNVIICFYAFSQISTGGTPSSFTLPYSQSAIPTITTSPLDMEAIEKEDLTTDVKASGYRFGIDFYYNTSIIDEGAMTILPNGNQLYRLRIVCPGAVSVSLTFDRYKLPAGGKLYVYSPNRKDILGAFTKGNNQEDGYFATTPLRGDEAIIEYEHPNNASEMAELRLWRVTHGYRGPTANMNKGFGDAGDCQINVRCPEGDGWENAINATCLIVDGGTELCSGTLINNTKNDGTPYLLTANHCHSLAPNTGTWVFWFNWESPTCENVTKSPAKKTLSGAKLVAYNYQTDFCLIKLNTAPPVSYQPVYCGWSRSNIAPNKAVCIHHPSLDVKKISPTKKIEIASFFNDPNRLNAWKAIWTEACTEIGSSGCSLFDSNQRIIGQLWGGASFCGAPQEKMFDYFGRLDLSWDSDNKNTRLRDWLDPDSSNIKFIDAYIPTTSIAEYTTQQKPQISIFPNPCQEKTTIAINGDNAIIKSIALHDVTGKLIMKEENIFDSQRTIQTSQLAKGVYMLYIQSNMGDKVEKLIIYR